MTEMAEQMEKARALLAEGEQLKALVIASDVLAAADDPDVLREVHELAVEGHDRAVGLQKIHWRELMIAAEARREHPVA